MEFIEGRTPRELLNEGALSAKYYATLLRQAARRSKPFMLATSVIAIVRKPDETIHGLAGLAIRLSTLSIELIARALEFDPARRPRTVREFTELIAADLEKGLG